ncbi:hypothetical protein GWE_00135 [Chlamydia psittaci NJ1]|uniref:Uncharacterized protein n=1 Tax=Chlamydia psittaci 99DC5 TaxID=1112251 RepID=A0ABP2X320_CHLPS|nr:hypothetical protein B595_0361 [Chlamydia psittaci 84/55]AFS20433.1 hypothetical protein B598_0344 [Chlamydia psittaci GR9]AFS21832.1 hypothetical protein B599_0340 [Chlamydia psittaci MN]AFS22526.1 hypothetical protein B600_0364 [Chlamydia psittaci VS225]AFS23675.1 hypothetical protein B601_0341 [Chlamydia psittaci WS/RT/E30]AFS25200.1 hypothetical protein B602_0341 [Chlamydia psittaci M56]AFS25606.1 hypothetical protein B603_0347 [Chlamydia psittaci WC]AFS26768.1 hypothetical protein B7
MFQINKMFFNMVINLVLYENISRAFLGIFTVYRDTGLERNF